MLGCNRCGHIWDNCECTDKEVIGADRDIFEDSVCKKDEICEHDLSEQPHSFSHSGSLHLCKKCGGEFDKEFLEDLNIINTLDSNIKLIKDLGSHYKQGSIQPIEVIADMGYKIPFCLGNAIKYIMRCEHKDNMKEDLQKAINYLNMVIED